MRDGTFNSTIDLMRPKDVRVLAQLFPWINKYVKTQEFQDKSDLEIMNDIVGLMEKDVLQGEVPQGAPVAQPAAEFFRDRFTAFTVFDDLTRNLKKLRDYRPQLFNTREVSAEFTQPGWKDTLYNNLVKPSLSRLWGGQNVQKSTTELQQEQAQAEKEVFGNADVDVLQWYTNAKKTMRGYVDDLSKLGKYGQPGGAMTNTYWDFTRNRLGYAGAYDFINSLAKEKHAIKINQGGMRSIKRGLASVESIAPRISAGRDVEMKKIDTTSSALAASVDQDVAMVGESKQMLQDLRDIAKQDLARTSQMIDTQKRSFVSMIPGRQNTIPTFNRNSTNRQYEATANIMAAQ